MEPLLQTLTGLDVWVLYALLGLLVFGESSAVVALLLPGEVALLVGGALAARGHGSLPVVVLVAAVAAVCGHAAGYEVGRRYGVRLLGSRVAGSQLPGRYAEAVGNAAALVVRHGGVAVFLGRWMNVGRIVVPLLVGAQRMPYRTFTLFNVVGAVAWVLTFVVLGAAAGASLEVVERAVGQASWWVLGAVVIGIAARAVWRRRRRSGPDAAVRAGSGGPAPCTVTAGSSSRREQDA